MSNSFFTATACTKGFVQFSADGCQGGEEKLSDSLTAHAASKTDRKREGAAKCSHVYPLIRGSSSTCPLALVSGHFLFRLHSHSPLSLKVQVTTCSSSKGAAGMLAGSKQQPGWWRRRRNRSVCRGSAGGGGESFQLSDSKRILHALTLPLRARR